MITSPHTLSQQSHPSFSSHRRAPSTHPTLPDNLQIRQLGDRRPRTAPAPPLALAEPNRLFELGVLPELAAHRRLPLVLRVGAEPVLGRAAQHHAAELALPAVALLLAFLEGVLGQVGGGRLHSVVRAGPAGGGGVRGDVGAQALAGEGQHDEDEVDAQRPEAGDQGDAHDAAALEDGAA